MGSRFVRLAMAMTAALSSASPTLMAASEEAFEPPPILRASDLLSASALRGSHYHIADEVMTSDSKFVFTILTPFGRLRAVGLPMLEIRLSELEALHRLRELSAERSPPLLEGAMQSLADTPKGAGLIVTDPLGSLERAPKGLRMMVMSRIDPADRKAGPPLRRWLADALSCDPETNNPLLDEELDRWSQRKLTGKLIGRIGMSAPVPGLGLLSLTADIKKMTLDQPPHAINRALERELRRDGVTAIASDAFCRLSALTTSQRLLLMRNYRTLADIPGRAHLIDAAASADDEARALSAVLRVKMIADLHQTSPIRTISNPALPLVELADGRFVVVFSDDLLYDSSEWRRVLRSTRAAIVRQDAEAVLLIAGRVTLKAQAMAEGLGFRIAGRRDGLRMLERIVGEDQVPDPPDEAGVVPQRVQLRVGPN